MNKILLKKLLSLATATTLALPMIFGLPKAFAEQNKIPVNFTKVDRDTNNPVEGATIAIKKLTGNKANTGTIIFTAKTDSNGKLVKDDNNASFFDSEGRVVLDAGNQYEFVETAAPNGYALNEIGQLQDTVKSDAENPAEINITIENTKLNNLKNYLKINTQVGSFAQFDISLYKMKNGNDTDPTKGVKVFEGSINSYDGKLAEFAKYDPDGYLINGDLSLPDTYYILVENKTNRSYKISFANSSFAHITLLSNNKNGNTNSNNVNSSSRPQSSKPSSSTSSTSNSSNKKASSSLAKTGIASFTPMYIAAGTMISVGGTILFKKKK